MSYYPYYTIMIVTTLYKIYFDDLIKSQTGKLISRTEDLFLLFWTLSTKKQKKGLIIPLKKWINSNEKTNTIKGIFIKSMILRTKEPYPPKVCEKLVG